LANNPRIQIKKGVVINPEKIRLFSTPAHPYIKDYVPESVYVEQVSGMAVQLNATVQMVEAAQRQVVELCRAEHGWHNCVEGPAGCPRIMLRAILHVPPQARIEEMVNKAKLVEGTTDEIDAAISRTMQDIQNNLD